MRPRVELSQVSKIYSRSAGGAVAAFGKRLLGLPAAPRNGAGKVAVDAVSLALRAGERLGIIGSNGAGKSTLLRMIAGLAAPSSGRIDVEGQVTAIFTLGLGLKEDLTGRDNIYVDGEVQGKTRREIDRVIDEIVAFADIGDQIDHPLRTYSTGMKARLAFASIIHLSPEILIIDEALSAGDAQFSAKARAKMREICSRGKIGIIVSHAMPVVNDLCTRCVWMEGGRVVLDGDPDAVTRAYLESSWKRDEAALLDRFRRHVGAESARDGCHVLQLEAVAPGRPGHRPILFSGDDVEWNVRVSASVALAAPDARFRMERLDGLVVADSLLSVEGVRAGAPTGDAGFRIAMRPLVLGAGVYRATLDLLDRSVVVASRSTIVEVAVRQAPTGGKPVLLYPASVHAYPAVGVV